MYSQHIRCWMCKNWSPTKETVVKDQRKETVGTCKYFTTKQKTTVKTSALQRCEAAELADDRDIKQYVHKA